MERHEKYLGLPTMVGRSKAHIFKFVRDRVWKKLIGWKEKALSKAGRVVLISRLFNLPHLCYKLFSITAMDLWWDWATYNTIFLGGDVNKRKIHWISRKRLSKSMKKGGLGFHFVKSFNLPIIAKQWAEVVGEWWL